MAGYSKLKEIELFNFMSFKHTRLVFDETNILNIKGYNDSGKSAILRALMVCLADMFKRAQSKYIRYGEEYFRIVVTFDDGVSILRDKYSNGQSLYEMYKEGKCIYTTKQGNTLSRIDGVPETISNYIGLCLTDNGCLNYQSCNDKLLLVETTGSENYQDMHTALKSEELSRAMALINSDRNEMNQKLLELEGEYRDCCAVLKSRSFVSEETIAELEERDRQYDKLDAQEKKLVGIADVYDALEAKESIPQISEIDSKRLEMLESQKKLSEDERSLESIPEVLKLDGSKFAKISEIHCKFDKQSSLTEVPEMRRVDTRKLSILSSMTDTAEKLRSSKSYPEVQAVDGSRLSSLIKIRDMIKNISGADEIPEVSVVDTSGISKMKALYGIQSSYLEYMKACKELKTVNNEMSAVTERLEVLISEARNHGIYYEVCPNCGTYVAVSN